MWKYALASYLAIHAIGYSIAETQSMEELTLSVMPSATLSKTSPNPEDPPNVFNCEGYLSNNPAEEFCSEEVPDDWQRFDFNGEPAYLVPLINEKKSS